VTSRLSKAAITVLLAFLLALACGDDENNPQGGGTNPTPAVLAASVESNTAILTWNQCPDDDFSSYVLYRSETSGIAQSPSSATVVTTITAQGTLTYTDADLNWNTPYYYAIQTVDSSQLTAWSNETSITTPDSSGGSGNALTCYQIQGQSDVSPYANEDVSVTGIVTVGGDEYYAGSGTAQYSVIEDASGGEWSGLVLYGYDGVLTPLERGDSVVVSGYVSEYYELTEVVVQSVDFDEAGHTIPAPEALTTGGMSQEKWEGVLVTLSDVTVTSDPTHYGEFFVDDGTGDAMVDDRGIYGFSTSTGTTYSEMTGVVFYEYSSYRLEPRNESDIIQ
jgi:predicted extracellular nuclease